MANASPSDRVRPLDLTLLLQYHPPAQPAIHAIYNLLSPSGPFIIIQKTYKKRHLVQQDFYIMFLLGRFFRNSGSGRPLTHKVITSHKRLHISNIPFSMDEAELAGIFRPFVPKKQPIRQARNVQQSLTSVIRAGPQQSKLDVIACQGSVSFGLSSLHQDHCGAIEASTTRPALK